MTFWGSRRVLVTGGAGFLGRNLVRKLAERGAGRVDAPPIDELDLRDKAAIRAALGRVKPDLVIHAAAIVGGIGANRAHPGRFFYENAVMGIELIEEARRAGVGKLVCLGTICAYPKLTPVPFREEDLWNGYPEETNAPYGLAKKMLLVQLQAYRAEYGFNGVFLLPVNLYGPGDNFDLETSHVIPAMIRKFSEATAAGAPEVSLWGDGSPTREFLFVEDAAEGILAAAERYDGAEPVNLGSGEEISVRDLAALVARETGYAGAVRWDASKPNGQPRRRLDVSRAGRLFGWRAATPLADGLRRTVAWYRESPGRA
ncbi:MAG TPA: GDP-L-fucose synthase [Thermoanaerobaculia bacterium]|nr:GDP-L-fucose synthase [Thermoanaerobaculia bacterium]HQR67582.1 GDP-L-fucose synthase [Thermoanaerobaculia bacterium]